MINKPKRLMLLGGLRYLIPVIEIAHRLGIYVITVDFLPGNIAHQYSDEYHNISILDKEAVLGLAKQKKIDGIMSFAVDPGVLTAAYVAEKMNLPFQGSFATIQILQDKSSFREFLQKNKFNVPIAKGYVNVEQALQETLKWKYPLIVKPVDSAGSKGVTKVYKSSDLKAAIHHALDNSHNKKFIIEEFIEKDRFSSDSDSFVINGTLQICTFSDQYFDINAENPFTPSAYSWPSTMEEKNQEILKLELQRLMTLLEIKTGIFNIETRVGIDGKCYIMEVSPRGGGNRLAEMIDAEYKTNLIENAIRSSVGLPLIPMPYIETSQIIAEIILHADKDGVFKKLYIDDILRPYIIQTDLWVKPGDYVTSFKGANNSIGTLKLKFPERAIMESILNSATKRLRIEVS